MAEAGIPRGLVVLALVRDQGEARVLAAFSAGASAGDDLAGRPFPCPSGSSAGDDLAGRPSPSPSGGGTAPREPQRRSVGPLAIDATTRRVTLAGRPLELTRGEFDLLAQLAAAPGQVFTKQELLGVLGAGPAGGPTRRLDTRVARLRRRLGDHRGLLVTVWGIGYRLG